MTAKVVGTFLSLSVIFLTSCAKPQAPPAMPPPEVLITDVVQRDVPTYGEWVATLDGYQNAQIQPQVSGYLLKQNYREGSVVHKGDVLFEIDQRPFQALLDQAKGQLAQANGLVAQANAQLQLAEINVKRDQPLAAQRAIAQSQLDTEVQAREQQKATVQSAEAQVQSARAAVEQAELNIGFTKVRSLLDGIAGIATTQIGNLVNPSTVLTTVSQVNPVKAYFPISENEYLRLAPEAGQKNQQDWLRASSRVPLQLTLSNGQVYSAPGHIAFADRQVDTQTGTIRVVGVFANPANLLRPGAFGRIRARTGVDHNALLIPQRAVSELQGHYQVFTVTDDNKVHLKTVTLGDRVGSLWIIASGLNLSDKVITEGITKVRDGATVSVKRDPHPEQQNAAQASGNEGF